jgi:hypothetical protein
MRTRNVTLCLPDDTRRLSPNRPENELKIAL